MKTLLNSRQNAGVLPTLAALLLPLLSNPARGKAQGVYTVEAAGKNHDLGSSEMANIVSQLEYNALLALLGAVVLMGVLYICHVWKACTDLRQAQKNTRNLIIVVAGLSVFCGSCSIEQQAMAAQYRASAGVSHRNYASPCQHENYANILFNNRYPSNGYSNWQGPAFCKYCGQRIFNARN